MNQSQLVDQITKGVVKGLAAKARDEFELRWQWNGRHTEGVGTGRSPKTGRRVVVGLIFEEEIEMKWNATIEKPRFKNLGMFRDERLAKQAIQRWLEANA